MGRLKSKRQARFMFDNHPTIAKRWVKKMGGKGSIKRLPETARGGSRKRKKK